MSNTHTVTMTSGSSQPLTTGTFGYYLATEDDAPLQPNDIAALSGIDSTRRKDITLPVRDVRGHESTYTLSQSGFCFRTQSTALDLRSTENEKAYQQEMLPLLKKEFPTATAFHFFPLLLRNKPRSTWTQFKSTADLFNSIKSGQPPSTITHIDWTGAGMAGIVEGAVDASIGRSLRENKNRLIGLSIWRPLSLVKSDPLAVINAKTFDPATECKVVPRTTPSGAYYENRVARYSDKVHQHEWCWLSGQKPEEMTWIKLADTDPEEGEVEAAAHNSFALAGTGQEQDVRESVELRVVVVF